MAKAALERSNKIKITVIEEIKCVFDEELKIYKTTSTIHRTINDD